MVDASMSPSGSRLTCRPKNSTENSDNATPYRLKRSLEALHWFRVTPAAYPWKSVRDSTAIFESWPKCRPILELAAAQAQDPQPEGRITSIFQQQRGTMRKNRQKITMRHAVGES